MNCGVSSKVEHAGPPCGGGSSPTTPLHIDAHVEECDLREIKDVIERVHYSHSVFGVTVDHCYGVFNHNRTCLGGAIFGKPAAYNVSRKYDNGEPLVELRRFVLVDELPKNSESRLLAHMLRDLRKKGVRRVLSYADPSFGHEGVIYKATGFKYIGRTSPRNYIMWNGERYPDRNLHQTKFPYHAKLRAAVEDGSATRFKIPGKHIYLKVL